MDPHGFFDPGLAPAVTVDPGATVRLRTLESGWSPEPFDIDDLGSRVRHPAWTEGAGHALTGPVEVRGARAGQVLEIRIDAVVPGRWGTTYANARPSVFNDAYEMDGAEARSCTAGRSTRSPRPAATSMGTRSRCGRSSG